MLLIKIMIWVLIAGFAAMTVISAYNLSIYYRIKKNGAFAEGTIVGLKEKTNIIISMGTPINREEPKLVHPIVEYTDSSGMPVRAVYRGFELKGKGTYTEGDQVQIKYDPSKPNDFIITGDGNFHCSYWYSAVLGAVFAAFCIFIYKAMLF